MSQPARVKSPVTAATPPVTTMVTRLARVDFVHPGVPIGMGMTHYDFIDATETKPIELRHGLVHYGADVYPLHVVKRMVPLKATSGGQ